jgi:methylaspartate ammonia-lyase
MDVLTLTARPVASARVIATAAMETQTPVLFAAWLDELAAHESGYRISAAGDCPGLKPGDMQCTRELHARSCGAWQTPCARTPKTGLDQARLAIRILQQAVEQCADHPLWAYASGSCNKTRVAALYEREVQVMLATHPYVETIDS